MKPIAATATLAEEHRKIEPLLDRLALVAQDPDAPSPGAGSHGDLIRQIEEEFIIHLAREEKVLFPSLEQFLPRDAGPVAVMLNEHTDLRADLATIKETAPLLGPSASRESVERFRQAASRFVSVLRAHIHKEDHILFPMAEMHLDQTAKERVSREIRELTA